MWREPAGPLFTDSLTLDMGSVEPSLAGPKRPQDRVTLPQVQHAFDDFSRAGQADLAPMRACSVKAVVAVPSERRAGRRS